jgi:lipoyl-dependent peroxiredoxin
MALRTAEAQWDGTLKDGKGRFWTESGEVSGVYSFSTRFEEEQGSNPEELIGAALAGCFSMQFAADLDRAGHAAESVRTVASVHLDPADGGGFEISGIDLDAEVRVAGIDASELEGLAKQAKEKCPVGRALASVPVTVRVRCTR